jgi:hypothetical protein
MVMFLVYNAWIQERCCIWYLLYGQHRIQFAWLISNLPLRVSRRGLKLPESNHVGPFVTKASDLPYVLIPSTKVSDYQRVSGLEQRATLVTFILNIFYHR